MVPIKNIIQTLLVKISRFEQGLWLKRSYILERLSMTLHQTANGKNETFAVSLQLSVQ